MALINCPECGKEISEKAYKCLYCGVEFNVDEFQEDEDIKPESKAEECSTIVIEQITDGKHDKINYGMISITTIILGLISWGIGIYKVLVYTSGEVYPYNSVNAYVGGDAYNILINGIYFTGLAVIGGTLILSGILVMVYEKIQKS